MGYDVLSQDADVVWHVNPLPFFSLVQRQRVDIFWMYDGGNHFQQPVYANGGFFVARSNTKTRRYFYEVSVGSEFSHGQQRIMAPLLIHHYFNHGLQISAAAGHEARAEPHTLQLDCRTRELDRELAQQAHQVPRHGRVRHGLCRPSSVPS